MKKIILCISAILSSGIVIHAGVLHGFCNDTHFFGADNKNIQYTGRIDFSDIKRPRFWQPGVYIKAGFKGTFCDVIITDEMPGSTNHNYIEIIVDDSVLYRVKLTGKTDTLHVAKDLFDSRHTIMVCKNTEAGLGYLEFVGFRCKSLLPLPEKPSRKLEFIGNSITCGTGSDLSEIGCGKGKWEDQHNAYLSYGPTVARTLNAQWQLSSVSGIGLIHSCCDLTITMPEVFDKTDQRDNKISWNFNKYQPDAISICLGQNDGIQNSKTFCDAYISFIQKIRGYYPGAQIVCLTSPMADAQLNAVLKKYITIIVDHMNNTGDKKVHKFFFLKQFHNGCDGHPDVAEHAQIAKELGDNLKLILGW